MSEAVLRQEAHSVRFEWGAIGAQQLAHLGDVVVVVDVLSFSTAVSVAMERGMRIQPVAEATDTDGRAVAVRREETDPEHPWSLSPLHLRQAPHTPLLLLPSPNGATIAQAASTVSAVVMAGCLRNARATAIAARRAARGLDPAGQRRRPVNGVVVIAAGERWPDGSLRPALEDLLGAGAIIAELVEHCGVPLDSCSPEARMAMQAWNACDDPAGALHGCASGLELHERGYREDVTIALEHNSCDLAALLSEGSFTPVEL